MAWYYNAILSQNFEIGLVAISRRHTSPRASTWSKFAFFLTNSQIQKFSRLENGQKRHF